MVLFGLFKKRSILTQEQQLELQKIESTAYFEKAKELLKSRGEKKAQDDIMPIKPINPYQ